MSRLSPAVTEGRWFGLSCSCQPTGWFTVLLLTACPPLSHPRGESTDRGTSKICVQTTQAPRLDTLVEHLVPISLRRGPTFVPTFVWTHRTFATSQQVLGRLFTR